MEKQMQVECSINVNGMALLLGGVITLSIRYSTNPPSIINPVTVLGLTVLSSPCRWCRLLVPALLLFFRMRRRLLEHYSRLCKHRQVARIHASPTDLDLGPDSAKA